MDLGRIGMVFPIDCLVGNYLDVLADASFCVSTSSLPSLPSQSNSAADIRAAAVLAEAALSAGSSIDVFCPGLFWEAEVTRVDGDCFFFRYLDANGRLMASGGKVRRDGFLSTWRFPLRVRNGRNDIRNARLMASAFCHD